MAEPTLRQLIAADVANARIWFGSALTHLFPNVFVAVCHRVAHALDRGPFRPLAQIVSVLAFVITGAEIRPGATIGPGLVIIHPGGIVIGSDVVAGRDLVLFGKNTLGRTHGVDHERGGSPVLGNNVRVGTTASILGPVTVGDDAEIGAHSLVVRDVPVGGTTKAPAATPTRGPAPSPTGPADQGRTPST